MIAMSAALAFGPAMDAARSPERRVKMKLTTRTVRHTKAASHSLRNINHFILDNYDSERVTARRCRTLEWRHMNLHVNLPVFSAYARNVLANMPKPTAAAAALIRHPDLPSNEFQCVQAKRSSRKLVRNWRRDRAGECLSDAFWPANRPTPAASQEQPRAQNRETGGELAHRSLITDVLQSAARRRINAHQSLAPIQEECPSWHFSEMALRLISAYGSKSRLSKTLETEFQF